MAETLKVKSGRSDGRVALAEKDDLHPGGEVFIGEPVGVEAKDYKVHDVGKTAAVNQKILSGDLIKVSGEK